MLHTGGRTFPESDIDLRAVQFIIIKLLSITNLFWIYVKLRWWDSSMINNQAQQWIEMQYGLVHNDHDLARSCIIFETDTTVCILADLSRWFLDSGTASLTALALFQKTVILLLFITIKCAHIFSAPCRARTCLFNVFVRHFKQSCRTFSKKSHSNCTENNRSLQ